MAGSDYEVFLSFRGSDTRTGFADYLYTSLKRAGIRAFRDNENLRVGHEISKDLLKGITRSKICIPIFSKGYASSKWCLKEVAHMLKCKNQLVLPIFYDVSPHQVRHQSGTYEKAFKEHSRRYDKKTVEEWRNALVKIGALKGWELQKEANGHQGALVNLVVSEVLRKLKKAHLVVNDNSIRLEGRARGGVKQLNVGGDDVGLVVVLNTGGKGITTVAKTAYNQLCKGFQRWMMQARQGLNAGPNKTAPKQHRRTHNRIKDDKMAHKRRDFAKYKSPIKQDQRKEYERGRLERPAHMR